MPKDEILPVNFTISAAAKTAIERLRREHDAEFSDPAAVLSVGWGIYAIGTASQFENVVLGFYGKSELSAIAHGIQEVSGVKLVFFITAQHYGEFEGKVLDFMDARRFFLRAP